jgi:hypothetical protein
MIPRIKWPHSGFNLRSPFDRGKNERPLQITFDSQALKNISSEEADALSLLYELSHLDIVSALIFEGNEFPRITFAESNGHPDYSSITIIGIDGEVISWNQGIYLRSIDDASVTQIVGMHSSNMHEELIKTRDIILPLEAHSALNRDIFVTTSPLLLKKQQYWEDQNVRTPLETLKIVGLFIRSRNEWAYKIIKQSKLHSPREFFYRTLARVNLSHISTLSLAGTVTTRCARALQARDEIGKLFYSFENKDLNDEILYHFDYLNILLMGALDAAAVAINERYSLVNDKNQQSFKNKNFKQKIKHVIPRLSEFIESEPVKTLIDVVSKLRNTVHSEALGSNGRLVIKLPDALRDHLWSKVQEHGDNSKWGLEYENYRLFSSETNTITPKYRITLEPYTYAMFVTEEFMKLLDSLACILQEELSDSNTALERTLSETDLDYAQRVSLLG